MKKKVFSLILAFALVFSLSSVAFAASTDAPTESTSVSSIAGVTGITVNGTSAYYEYDDNTGSGNVYIRAILPSTTTEYDLENATVQINKTMTTSIGGDIAFTGGMTSVSATVDLFNNAYTVTINNVDYTLAAGIETGTVAAPTGDSITMDGATVTMDGYNVQNPFMGNPYYIGNSADSGIDNGWTFINYFARANFTTEPSNRSSVSGTINGSPYTFDLSDTMPTVTVGARTYYIAATFPGQINVKFKLNFPEYTGTQADFVNARKAEMINAGNALWGDQDSNGYWTATVDSGSTVMALTVSYLNFGADEYFSSNNNFSSTYIGVMNGLGFPSPAVGQGWMYYINENWATVGAASYNLTVAGTAIRWDYLIPRA